MCTLFEQSVRGETTLLETLRKGPKKSEIIDACKGEVQEIEASESEMSE